MQYIHQHTYSIQCLKGLLRASICWVWLNFGLHFLLWCIRCGLLSYISVNNLVCILPFLWREKTFHTIANILANVANSLNFLEKFVMKSGRWGTKLRWLSTLLGSFPKRPIRLLHYFFTDSDEGSNNFCFAYPLFQASKGQYYPSCVGYGVTLHPIT